MNTASGLLPLNAETPRPVVTSDEAHTTGGGNYSEDAIIARARVLCLAYAEHRARRDYEAAKVGHAATARHWRRWALAKAALIGRTA